MHPDLKYAKTPGGVHIAYTSIGDGPPLLLCPTLTWSVEWAFEDPACSRFVDHLAEFSRVILFDKRGTGRSDPIVGAPTLEERAEDITGVLDAAMADRAVILGLSEGGSMAAMFAATRPERTAGLIMYGTMLRTAAAPGDTEDPYVMPADFVEPWVQATEANWGSHADLGVALEAEDPARQRSDIRRQQLSASPAMAAAIARLAAQIDIRPILPSIRVPTIVLHRSGEVLIKPEHARYIASKIPDARYIELPGTEHFPWLDQVDPVIAEVEDFLTGVRPETRHDRALATILFTDLVSSTDRASEMGDNRWRHVVEQHEKLVRGLFGRHRGKFNRMTGDGALGTFDGPSRAVRCAKAIVESVEELGVQARAGVHVGEIELFGDDIGGIAVHIARRVMDQAGPREVLASSTVKDLAVGSGIMFEDHGVFELKGVPDSWRLYRAKIR